MTAVKLTEVRFLSPVTAEGRKESGLDSVALPFLPSCLLSFGLREGREGAREGGRKEGKGEKAGEGRVTKRKGKGMVHVIEMQERSKVNQSYLVYY